MNKKNWLHTGAIALLLATVPLSAADVSAASLKELQQQKKEADSKKSNLQQDINQKKSAITTNQSKIDDILGKIKELNQKIEKTNGEMNTVRNNIAQTKKEIEKLRESIEDLEQKIEERDVVLRERARTLQTRGTSVSYVEVLLGASSFADFIDRFSTVTTLVEADRNIMRQQQADIEQLEEEKELVENKLSKLEQQEAELKDLKSKLDGQKQQQNKLVDQLEAEQQKLSEEKTELEEEFHEVYEVSKELEGQIVAEQRRLAEVARKIEAERKAALAAQQQNNSGGSSSSSSNSSGNIPAVSAGSWTKPANGRYTSGFGWRKHPIQGIMKQHRGIDIANSVGTPVVAASDGVVSKAGWMAGFGNVIMITHSINGQIYTTVYAHLSGINVSSGQQVSKGQRIGAMGNTGNSKGSHLHFEVHVGTFSGSGPSAVNPLRFVSL